MRIRFKPLFTIGLLWVGATFIGYLGCIYFYSFSLSLSLPTLFVITSFFTLFVIVASILILQLHVSSQNIASETSTAKKGQAEELYLEDAVTPLLRIISVMSSYYTAFKTEVKPDLPNSDKAHASQALSKLAHYDKDILLPNQVLFNEILNKSVSHARRHKKVLGLLLIDIQTKNAEQGFSEAELKTIGENLSKALRNEDAICKLDGHEFIVLLTDISKPKFASAVAEKILRVCSPRVLNFEKLDKTSIGISIYPNDGDNLEELISRTYQALTQQKQMLQSGYQFYSKHLDIEAHEYIQTEQELFKAIEKKELTMYYQPKVHLKSGQIIGVEALIRWVHPKLGLVSPQQFLPIAEDNNLIIKIGEWALREVCLTNKFWQDEGFEHMSVSLNLSPKQFYHPQIVPMIRSVLQETGLNANYLELEITESIVMDNLEKTKEILESIKNTGVQISMDHFGTGYTSISHLKKLPITIVKIDQNYIKGIPNNQIDTAIAGAIINLGRNLGLRVVAEGVETAEQLQFLAASQCDIVQGYFLSYPMPAYSVSEQFKKLTDNIIM